MASSGRVDSDAYCMSMHMICAVHLRSPHAQKSVRTNVHVLIVSRRTRRQPLRATNYATALGWSRTKPSKHVAPLSTKCKKATSPKCFIRTFARRGDHQFQGELRELLPAEDICSGVYDLPRKAFAAGGEPDTLHLSEQPSRRLDWPEIVTPFLGRYALLSYRHLYRLCSVQSS